MYFITTAQLTFYRDYGVAYLDDNINQYYFSLLPRYYNAQRQMWPAHITFLRLGKEKVPDSWNGVDKPADACIMYEGKIKRGGDYFYLDAWSYELSQLRQRLGLTPYRPGFDRFHITIGNTK